jgi:hypothetical protein
VILKASFQVLSRAELILLGKTLCNFLAREVCLINTFKSLETLLVDGLLEDLG